jgi:DNA-binding response OmpR family regulator
MARILFVENHAVFANQVARAFLNDHEVTTVPGLSEARAVLAKGVVDAVLVDYDLDDGKGAELVRELQSRRPRPFIVAVSSHDEGNAAMLAAGADAVCGKMEFSRIGSVITNGLTEPLQPTRAAGPNEQHRPARSGPRG